MDFSGINDINSDLSKNNILVKDGIIYNNNSSTIKIYSISGQCVYNGSDKQIDRLPKGIYIVRSGNKNMKIAL